MLDSAKLTSKFNHHEVGGVRGSGSEMVEMEFGVALHGATHGQMLKVF